MARAGRGQVSVAQARQRVDRQDFTFLREHTVREAAGMLRRQLQRAGWIARDHTARSCQQIEFVANIAGSRASLCR